MDDFWKNSAKNHEFFKDPAPDPALIEALRAQLGLSAKMKCPYCGVDDGPVARPCRCKKAMVTLRNDLPTEPERRPLSSYTDEELRVLYDEGASCTRCDHGDLSHVDEEPRFCERLITVACGCSGFSVAPAGDSDEAMMEEQDQYEINRGLEIKIAALKEGLRGAAKSLESLSLRTRVEDDQVRGYAASRSRAAYEALGE